MTIVSDTFKLQPDYLSGFFFDFFVFLLFKEVMVFLVILSQIVTAVILLTIAGFTRLCAHPLSWLQKIYIDGKLHNIF